MEPDLWTAFVFFGIPLVVGLLGVRTGSRLCYRAYLQYSTGLGTEWREGDASPERGRTWRGNVVRGVALFFGGGLVTLHSARWLAILFGVL